MHVEPLFTEAERIALAGFLAGYSGLTRDAYALDLRQYTSWCQQHELHLFQARRPDIECFGRDMEARGRARATIARRLCTVSGFYRYAVEEELLEHSPAVHVRRPRLDYESHAIGLDRKEVGSLLVAAGLGAANEHALISLLGINGLRISEALGADIDKLGLERGHRTLTVLRKGGKIVVIPLGPRTARAIDLAIGERLDGSKSMMRRDRSCSAPGATRPFFLVVVVAISSSSIEVPHAVSPTCYNRLLSCPERAAVRVLPVRLQVGSYRSSVGSDGVAEWLTSLRSVRAVEQAATTHAQRLAAVHASGRLFAAAQLAGWSYRQLADATGVSLFVVKSRAQSAVSRGDPTAGLDIPNIRPAANGASPTGPSPWLSTQQVRAATGIGRSMLYRWRVTGLLPQARFTQRQWQYHRDDVDALIAMRGELKTLPKKTIQRAVPAPHLRVPPPASFQPQVGDRNKAHGPQPRGSS